MSKPINFSLDMIRPKLGRLCNLMLLLSVLLMVSSVSLAASTDALGVGKALGLPDANGASPYSAQGNPVVDQAAKAPPFTDSSTGAISPVDFDYASVPPSDAFGARLFSGAFSRGGPITFNPDYMVSIGDKVHIRLWGAFNFDSSVTVDAKGNVFLPNVGPVKLAGVRSKNIQQAVNKAVRRVYQKNVLSYASLEAAQPVRVFVSGFVRRPGLYDGTSMDSLLHYLDQAGGIDPERGSFLRVEVKRGKKLRHKINLYDFLLSGAMPLVQFADGDVIFVTPRKYTVKVSGLAENPNRFEFQSGRLSLSDLVTLAKPSPVSTHVRVVRNTGAVKNVEFYELNHAGEVFLADGDEAVFVADKKPGTITVRVEGEHLSAQEYVLPYGSRLGDLLAQIEFSERSDVDALQLFRQSIKQRQQDRLQDTLKGLESAVLTARSGTNDEAALRTEEAALVLQWVERAKQIEPLGQVIITRKAERDRLLLENGDEIKVPTRDGLVVVSGEVLFPTAIAFSAEYSLDKYIESAGGFSQSADSSRIILAHRDGTFETIEPNRNLFGISSKGEVRDGDEILVLPKIDVKSRQIVKDLTQILYQIAVSAGVVLAL